MLHECMEEEDLKWHQKAKETWLELGDKNSKYFHAWASQRRSTNKITFISDDRGNMITYPDAVGKIFLDFFQEVLTTSNPTRVKECTAVLSSVVSKAMNNDLMKDVTMEEVTQALS